MKRPRAIFNAMPLSPILLPTGSGSYLPQVAQPRLIAHHAISPAIAAAAA